MKTISAEEFKKLHGEVAVQQFGSASKKKTLSETLFGPAKESFQGLKTLYGGSDQGIARKLKANITDSAKDIEQGFSKGISGGLTPSTSINTGGLKVQTDTSGGQDVAKGLFKAGLRTAGDVVGAVFAPIGAAIGATGLGAGSEYVADKLINNTKLGEAITDNTKVQQFAQEQPNAGEDFNRALNLAFSGAETGKIEPNTTLSRTKSQLTLPKLPPGGGIKTPEVFTKSVEQLRAEKIKQGYEEQNTRLKSADKSFNLNTKTYKAPDGTMTKVTPIDTLMKYNVTPVVEKGTINMGDYQTGQGALGKIKEKVVDLDGQIDSKLVDSGTGIPLDVFKGKVIEQVTKDPSFRQTGTVASTVKKLEGIFDDYRNSYGDVIHETEINAIRKKMNEDWKQETMDVSHAIGDAARRIIYDVTPDQAIKMLLRDQGELLSAKKYAQTINGTKVTGGRLGNMAMRTGGAILGSTLHNLPVIGPLLGMVGGEYLARGLQQTQFKSPIAEGRALLQRSKSATPTASAKITPKTAIISKSKPQPKPTSSSLSTLEAEARKYKSAEEFVKAQESKLFIHGSPSEIKGNLELKSKASGVQQPESNAVDALYVTPNTETGIMHSRMYTKQNGKIYAIKLKPDAKIFDYKNPEHRKIIDKTMTETQKRLVKDNLIDGQLSWMATPPAKTIKSLGFDGMKVIERKKGEAAYSESFGDTTYPEHAESLAIFNKNSFEQVDIPKTKSQLTDIYNKAVGKVKKK